MDGDLRGTAQFPIVAVSSSSSSGFGRAFKLFSEVYLFSEHFLGGAMQVKSDPLLCSAWVRTSSLKSCAATIDYAFF